MKRPPGEPCQRSRQWIQKKGRECSNTPRPAGQSPDGIIASARHDQVFAPARVRTSCRGRLLSTCHHVDKQSHDDAGHNLRGHVQQELHHRQSPPCGGTAPRILYHALSAGRKTKKPGNPPASCFDRASIVLQILFPVYPVRTSRKPLLSEFGKGALPERRCRFSVLPRHRTAFTCGHSDALRHFP